MHGASQPSGKLTGEAAEESSLFLRHSVTTIRDVGNNPEGILHQGPKTLLEDRS
jgi:hypothetical protein